MLEESADPELAEYARSELEILKQRESVAMDALRDVLYARQTDADYASLIMELRAGTGGDEAALFVRDLYEMYRRFA